MRTGLFRRRMTHNNRLFTAQYMDPKALFAFYFDMLPSVSYITGIDVNAACAHIRSLVAADVLECYQYSGYNRDAGRMEFNVSFIVLRRARLIELSGDYVTIFHGCKEGEWAAAILNDVARYRVQDTAKGPIGFANRQAVSH